MRRTRSRDPTGHVGLPGRRCRADRGGHPVTEPETIATAIRIGNPASWTQAEQARDDSGGLIEAVTDEEILAAHRVLSAQEGVFVEPASAAGVAGLLAPVGRGSGARRCTHRHAR